MSNKFHSLAKNSDQILSATIEEYNAQGLPTKVLKQGFSLREIYKYDLGDYRMTQKTFGGLTQSFEYYFTTGFLKMATDENGLKSKYIYDGLMRLNTTHSRFDGTADSPQDIQATTVYDYHYKNSATDYNYVGTSTSFKGVTTPLSTKQYLDALGRPMEVVKEGYTPNNLHLKNAVAYDALGRQNKTYLPFESSTTGFQAPSTSSVVHPFVLTEYEASPLSRPIKQTNVDGSIVSTSYGTNGANDVRYITNIASSNTVFYAANSLSKTTMTDENGKQTSVFKDKLGRVLLTRKFLSGAPVETYNVYDNYGQLTAVLPPGSVDGNGNVIQSLIFKYIYDNKNRLVEKQVPGAEPQNFFYDNRDLLVLTQDGNMRTENATKYLATIYDDLGRVKKTGFVFMSPTVGQDVTVTEGQITDLLAETKYYDNKSWVKHQGAKVLKPDGIKTNRDFVWSYIERREGITYTGNPVWTGKQHLLNAGQPERPILDADTEGVDWSANGYDGAQKPTLNVRYLYTGGVANEVRTYQTYSYDNGQRLTDTKYMFALNGANLQVPTFTLSNLNYNFKDQLTEKNIGLNGTNALQSIDYSYNLRGWLTAINSVNVYGNNNPIYTPQSMGSGIIQNLAISPLVKQAMLDISAPYKGANAMELPPVNDNNVDLFSERIDYGSPDSRTGATPQYNGNISAVTWLVAGKNKQSYGFKYDDLDRLTEATYFDLTDSYSGGQWNSTYSTDNKFKENMQYDLRGNIVGLQRNGYKLAGWTDNGYTAANYGLIDNLTYTYNAQNQVTRIDDATFDAMGKRPDKDLKGFVYDFNVGMSDEDHYTYDANGNLTSDKHKGITNIQYNYLNLPQLISFTENRSIIFVYDASGAKLQKITNNNGEEVTYNYVNGVEYKENVLQRLPHTEGAVVRNEFGNYDHEYVLRDHLGNVRVSFKDGTNKGEGYFSDETWTWVDPNEGSGYNDGVITQADMTQVNHFYSFGMNMEGNWNGSFSDAKNKYGYNEKELNTDFGLNWSDYGARFYDAAIGRWNTTDPLADKYYSYTPYNYVKNNPVKYVDPDGKIVKLYDSKQRLVATIGKDGNAVIEKVKGKEAYAIVTAYYEAKAYLSRSKSGKEAFEALESDTRTLKINENMKAELGIYKDPDARMENGERVYLNSDELGSIEWNTTLGSTDGEGNRHSPAMILLHEIFHGIHFKKSASQYVKDIKTKKANVDNVEEGTAIDETNAVSKELDKGDKVNDGGNGEDKKRTTHEPGKTFKAKSTTSNEEQK